MNKWKWKRKMTWDIVYWMGWRKIELILRLRDGQFRHHVGCDLALELPTFHFELVVRLLEYGEARDELIAVEAEFCDSVNGLRAAELLWVRTTRARGSRLGVGNAGSMVAENW